MLNDSVYHPHERGPQQIRGVDSTHISLERSLN